MRKQKEVQINFGLEKISILEYSIDNTKIPNDLNEPLKVNFNFELKFDIQATKKLLKFTFSFNVVPEFNKEIIIGKLKTELIFIINNLENLLDKNDNIIKYPDPFILHLINIVISTTRGIWAAKVEGSKLDHLILPFLNSKEILKSLQQKKIPE